MIETRLFQVLNTLTENRIQRIDFVLTAQEQKESPHFKLWCHLKDILLYNSKKTSKQQSYIIVFGDACYDDQKMRLLTSQLFKKVENIIASQEIEKSTYNKNKVLLRFYREQGLQNQYATLSKKTALFFKSDKIKDNAQLDAEIEFESIKFEHLLEQKRNQDLNLQKILDLTDLAYFAKKLKYICSAIAHQSVYDIKYNFGFIHEIENYLNSESIEKHPAVSLYYSCYKMLQDPDNKTKFERYTNDIRKYQSYFNNEEIRNIYLLGINICIKQLNKGNKEYGRIGLNMYIEGLAKKYLLVNNKITRYTYRNIAMIAIRVDDFEWAENFTEEYKGFLRASDKKSAYHFNKALINYNLQKLDEALDNILEVDFNDHLINLAAKTLQGKIYFELEQVDLLQSHLDSMEMYIIRKKVLGYYKENYRNIISYMRKLIRLNPYDNTKKKKLLTKVNAEKVLTEKSWLSGQLS